jgi:tetratricopeptide (TPR) repeat protein
MQFDSISSRIEQQTLQLLQKQPGNRSLLSFLHNHYLSSGKYIQSFSQAIALDKRFGQGITNTLETIKKTLEAKEYRFASIMTKRALRTFERADWQYQFKKLAIEIQDKQIAELSQTDTTAVKELVDSYEEISKEADNLEELVDITDRIAYLKMNFLDKPSEAISDLTKFFSDNSLPRSLENNLRMSLAQAYVLDNQPWEASLIYLDISRVEGDSDISHQAKLNNARIHFFEGNFDLAKNQLDILKLATTRLISNDAIDLSFIIQENLILDNQGDALKQYARITFLEEQKRFAEALQSYDTLSQNLGEHILQDDILYRMAQVSTFLSDKERPKEFYQKLIDKYPNSIHADNAYLELAKIFIRNNTESDLQKADQLLLDLIKKYPASSLQVEARKLLRNINTI